MDDGLLAPLVAALKRPLTPAEQMAIFCAGVQAQLAVPKLQPPPAAIRIIKPKSESKRATNAWKAAVRLDAVLTLWHAFLNLAMTGARLNDQAEEQFSQLARSQRVRRQRSRLNDQAEEQFSQFPDLQDVGAVLNALAEQVRWAPDLAQLLPEFDASLKIVRKPTDRHRDEDIRPFLGRRLQVLIAGFRKLIQTDAECLHLLNVNVPLFRRPLAEITSDIAKITCGDLDFTGDGVPIDAAKTLRSPSFQEALGRVRGAVRELLQQLETYPDAVLARQESTSSPKRSRSKPGMPREEAEVAVREYLTKHPKATREKVADAVGCSAGQVSRTSAWKLVAEARGKKKTGLKRIGLHIALEEKANALYEASKREEKNESPIEEGGDEKDIDGLCPEDREQVEAMGPDQRAEIHRLRQQQEKDARADRRRPRRR